MGKAIFVRRASVVAVGNKAMSEFIAEIKENESEESDSDGSMSGLQHMDVGDYV